MKQPPACLYALLLSVATAQTALPQDRDSMRVTADIVFTKIADIAFAKNEERELKLDLYQPKKADVRPPLVVWVHGGAWRAGSKDDMPLQAIVEHGYAVASVDYRLSPEAKFPAQIHDIKAAIRFLRAKADAFDIDASRIAVAGSSAGGHLAALVGVTNGQRELEGTVGEHNATSSDVAAIISLYGASNLRTILGQSTPFGLQVRVPALDLLLGGQPPEKEALARLASPVEHLDDTDPPLLLIHGDDDPQMPVEQSRELHQAYADRKLVSTLEIIPGGKHGGKVFYDEKRLTLMKDFLDRHLRKP